MNAHFISRTITVFTLVFSAQIFAHEIVGTDFQEPAADGNVAIADSSRYDIEMVIVDHDDAEHYKQINGLTEEMMDQSVAQLFEGQENVQLASREAIKIPVINDATADKSLPKRCVVDGQASFYGNDVGNKTASGERFDETLPTVAHKSLPFGTKIKVIYHGRAVIVKVNDRGPFVRNRVLDLAKNAAYAVGLKAAGVGKIRGEIVGCS